MKPIALFGLQIPQSAGHVATRDVEQRAPHQQSLQRAEDSHSPTEPAGGSLQARARVERLITHYAAKSGTFLHPDPAVSEAVKSGLAAHIDELNRPLCPCRFYPDKQRELEHRTWVCPCDDMQIYKYCHCLLFVTEQGVPVTEHLPPGHEGRQIYGETRDPNPERGRGLRQRAEERELERRRRPS